MSSTIQLWAKNNGQDFEIATLEELKRDGCRLAAVKGSTGYPLSDEMAQELLIRWFFDHHTVAASRHRGDRTVNALNHADPTGVEEAEDWLDDNIYDHMESLSVNGEEYLSQTPDHYVEDAKKHLNGVDGAKKHRALLWLAFLSMILDTPIGQMPETLRKAIKDRWKNRSDTTLLSTRPEMLTLHCAPGSQPLCAERMVVPVDGAVTLPVQLPDGRVEHLRLRPGANLYACYMGDRLTCIRSAIAANGANAAAMVDDRFCWCNRGIITPLTGADTDCLMDFAIDTRGRLYTLSAARITMPVDDERTIALDGAVGVLMLDSVWVVLHEDGHTSSNVAQLRNRRGVIAMTAAEDDLLLLSSEGEVCSMKGAACDRDQFYRAMLRPFTADSAGGANETVRTAGWIYSLDKTGSFEGHAVGEAQKV